MTSGLYLHGFEVKSDVLDLFWETFEGELYPRIDFQAHPAGLKVRLNGSDTLQVSQAIYDGLGSRQSFHPKDQKVDTQQASSGFQGIHGGSRLAARSDTGGQEQGEKGK